MNKTVGIILAVIILLLVAGGIFAFVYKNRNNMQTGNTAMSANKTNSPSVFSSIQDALSKNLVLQCDIDNLKGNKTVTYIKNGKIRVNVTGKTAAEATSVIVKDNKMYFWNAQGGFIMEFNPNEMGKNGGSMMQGTGKNPQAYLSMVEKYKDSCKPATVDDSLFIPPANIAFKDMSQIIKMAPSGTSSGASQGVNQAQIDQLMKQYGQPQ